MGNRRMKRSAALILAVGLLSFPPTARLQTGESAGISPGNQYGFYPTVGLQTAEASEDTAASVSEDLSSSDETEIYAGSEGENPREMQSEDQQTENRTKDDSEDKENKGGKGEEKGDTDAVISVSAEDQEEEEKESSFALQMTEQEEKESSFALQMTDQDEEKSEPFLQMLDKKGDESLFEIRMTGYSLPSEGKKLTAAVWSQANGQDDIRWYDLKETSDSLSSHNKTDADEDRAGLSDTSDESAASAVLFRAEVRPEDHKSSGSYYVHLYLQQKDGKMVFLDHTEFRVSPVTVGSLEITQDTEKPSTAVLHLRDVTCPSGIRQILVPVWSRSDQKDIHWYRAEKQEEGYWRAELKYSSHSEPSGTRFHVHVYGTSGLGMQDFAGAAQVQLSAPKPELTVTGKVGSLKAVLSNCSVKDPQSVSFAVWSAGGGQKDLRWHTAGKVTAGKTSVSIPCPPAAGIYIIHCYARDKAGKMIFQAPAEYTVAAPSAESVTGHISRDGRSMAFTLNGVSHAENLREVLFAVWSAEKGQDDIRWYSGKETDTNFTASAPVKNHPGKGSVFIHSYGKNASGSMVFLGNTEIVYDTSVKAEILTGELSQETFSADFTAEISAGSLAVQKVELAVWSASDQNDIHWYAAKKEKDTRWKAAFSPENHKRNAGPFHVHAYVTFVNGTRVFAGAAKYTPDLKAKPFFVQNADGTVTALLYTAKQGGSVNAAVWSSTKGQDDLKWYPMSYSKGCYSAVLSIWNHKHDGTYFAHMYQGSTFLGAGTFTFPVNAAPQKISYDPSWEFGGNSRIHSGSAVLYRAGENRKNIVIGVNAGHGCSGGASVYTLSHPDGSPKLTGGTNSAGAVRSTACAVGMSFRDGTPERTVTLQEAQILKELLLKNGFDVLMVRDGSDVQLDNVARTLICNQYADCHISIHWDGDGLGYDKGCFYMSVPNGLKSSYPVNRTWSASNRLGDCLISGLSSRNCRIFQSGSMQMDLTQTAYSKIPSVDIELGNAASDHSRGTLENLAQGLLKGIQQYYG